MKILFFIFLLTRIFGPALAEEGVLVQGESEPDTFELYIQMRLQEVINFAAFEQAMAGFKSMNPRKKGLITIIDFTKPSTDVRFCVLDLNKHEVLFTSHVAHGEKSGLLYAESFSNKVGSHQSSLGFYLTGETYYGRSGYSLRIDGQEKGINDNARKRAVVVHGAKYSDPKVIEKQGRLGRSQGCPALPYSISSEVIDTIKDGSVMYIHGNDPMYLAQSEILGGSQRYLAGF